MTTSSLDLTSNSSSITTNLPNITNFVPIKLDEHNFLNWKHQILTILKTLGLLKFLNQHIPIPPVDSAEREQWDRSDGYVSTFITVSLSSSFLYLARGTQMSSELWKNIEDSFSQQLFAKQHQYKTQFHLLRRESKSISNYLSCANELVDALDAVGDPITDQSLVQQILDGLNDDYKHFRLNIENHEVRPNFHQLRARLLTFEARLTQYSSTSVPHAAMAALSIKPPHHEFQTSLICQICAKTGHTAAACYFRFTPTDSSGRGRNSGGRWRGRNSGGRNGGPRFGGNRGGYGNRGGGFHGANSSDGPQWSTTGGKNFSAHVANLGFGQAPAYDSRILGFGAGN
ncbi:putative transcription factor interactor and regulator CCHC(Zn) family [Helianthus annuus]|nr:putative transcription factor interactor and regulator CCHC(Zn) family [Helianthus annuus]